MWSISVSSFLTTFSYVLSSDVSVTFNVLLSVSSFPLYIQQMCFNLLMKWPAKLCDFFFSKWSIIVKILGKFTFKETLCQIAL